MAMAAQLARPSGEAGTVIAANMNVANARLAERAIAALAAVTLHVAVVVVMGMTWLW